MMYLLNDLQHVFSSTSNINNEMPIWISSDLLFDRSEEKHFMYWYEWFLLCHPFVKDVLLACIGCQDFIESFPLLLWAYENDGL
jgi:hypothetical protein